MIKRKPFVVRRRTVDNAIADLPLFTDFSSSPESFDVFIGASGFEERVLGIPRCLVEKGGRIKGPVLLGRYRTNVEDNKQREQQLIPVVEALGGPLKSFDADSPEDTGRAIAALCTGGEQELPLRVLFDISGASSTLIFSAIAALASLPAKVHLTIGYAAAVQYHDPGDATRARPVTEWNRSALRESGVREVDTNELYRGIHHDHLPGYVIAFPSMYCARLQRCLSHLDVGPLSGATDSVFWVLPQSDDDSHRWRQESIKRSLLVLVHGGEATGASELSNDRHALCNVWDYHKCIRIVIEQVDRQEGANVSVIHMGTKVQAVGVALALLARPEVSLVSARPESFDARNYSEGIGSLHQIDIPDLQAAIRRIAEVGRLDIGCME